MESFVDLKDSFNLFVSEQNLEHLFEWKNRWLPNTPWDCLERYVTTLSPDDEEFKYEVITWYRREKNDLWKDYIFDPVGDWEDLI